MPIIVSFRGANYWDRYLSNVGIQFKLAGSLRGKVNYIDNKFEVEGRCFYVTRFYNGTAPELASRSLFLLSEKITNQTIHIVGYLISNRIGDYIFTIEGGKIFLAGKEFTLFPDHVHGFKQAWKEIVSSSVTVSKSLHEKLGLGGITKDNILPLSEINARISFSINQRFDIMEQLIEMLAQGRVHSMITSGRGGVGKTRTIMETLQRLDVYVYSSSGKVTPMGLFNMLESHSDEIIVFDDCDSVLQDSTSLNYLKAACDTKLVRTVTYERDNEIRRFLFTGKILFITNLDPQILDQALVSRSIVINLEMTREEFIERLRNVLPSIANEQEVSLELAEECLAHLEEFVLTYKTKPKDLTLRTIIKMVMIRASDPEGNRWRKIADLWLSTS